MTPFATLPLSWSHLHCEEEWRVHRIGAPSLDHLRRGCSVFPTPTPALRRSKQSNPLPSSLPAPWVSDRDSGTIEPGKRADLMLVNCNPNRALQFGVASTLRMSRPFALYV